MVDHSLDFYSWGGRGGLLAGLYGGGRGARWAKGALSNWHRASGPSSRGWSFGKGCVALHRPHNLMKRGTRAVWHASHWHWHAGGSDGRQARHVFLFWRNG